VTREILIIIIIIIITIPRENADRNRKQATIQPVNVVQSLKLITAVVTTNSQNRSSGIGCQVEDVIAITTQYYNHETQSVFENT
jgi:hypothetical protein